MCMVSMVISDFQTTMPPKKWLQFPEAPSAFEDLQKIIKLLEKIDKKLGQPDCIDPEKQKYLDEIQKALDNLKD